MSQAEDTRKKLRLALKQLQRDASKAKSEGTKVPRISISAVAKAVGVSHTLVHTKYPDIAEKIRAAIGNALLEQRQKKHDELKIAKDRSSELRAEIKSLRAENRGMASENARLTLLVQNLESRLSSKHANIPVIGD